jgi:RimJ/RimL family protein N-acetyltransferase
MITERPRKAGHAAEFEPESEFELSGTVEHAYAFEPAVDASSAAVCTEPRSVVRQDAPIVYYMGSRIYFRPLELSDERLLRRWINDPRIWRYLLQRRPTTEQGEREYLESLGKNGKDYNFGIVAKDGDRLIGSTALRDIDPVARSATFGILIGEVDLHGQGYGTEATQLALKFAFCELNLHRLQLSVFGNNWRAIRVYQKAGFVSEGCLRQAAYRDGQYVDEYRFAILREEWDRMANLEMPDNAYLSQLG